MKIVKTAEKLRSRAAASLKGRAAALALVFAAACALLPASPAAEGGKPGDIFNFGAGARPLAMGSAYTALGGDAASVYYNPAGLGMLAGHSVALMRAELFENAVYDYMGYAGSLKKRPGGWGLEMIRLASGDVEGRDENNNKTADFNYSETAFAAAAGLKGIYFPKLSMGASFKVLNRTLAASSDRHLAFDLGMQYGSLLRGRLGVGLLAGNIMSFASGDTSDKLPFLLKAGAAYRIIGPVLLAAELDNSGKFRIGTEYAIAIGALRAGLDDSAVSFGVGTVLMKACSLDLAITRHPVLGMSNRLSMGYRFGRAGRSRVEENPSVLAREYLQRARTALEERRYLAYLENIDKAMALDQSLADEKWGERYKRMSAVVEKLNLRYNKDKEKLFSAQDEQAGLAQAAMTAHLDSQGLKSMLYAHAAAGTNLREPAFEEFLNVLRVETGLPVKKDEMLPKPALITEKMRKADLDFQTMKFDAAAKECEEVLLLDEKNTLALTRLGSAYYAMGDVKRARDAYRGVLKLDPGNGSVLKFMKMQGWE